MKDNYIVSNFLDSKQFKITICGLIFNIIFVAFIFNDTTGYIECFISIYTNSYFILILLLIMLYNSLKIYEYFDCNNNYFMRYKAKEEYIKLLANSIVIVNITIYVVQLVITFIYLNIFHNYSLGLISIYEDCNCIIYAGYIILKHIILIYYLFDLLIYLFKLINKKIIIIVYLIIFITIPIQINSLIIYLENTFFPIHISYYFNYLHYNSFITEFINFLTFMFIFNLLVKIIKKFSWRQL